MVRCSGIGSDGESSAPPCGSSARYFWPSSVLIRMAAVVWSPSHASPTRKLTSTWSSSISTSETVPTFTPAMRTSLSGRSPAASVNCAV